MISGCLGEPSRLSRKEQTPLHIFASPLDWELYQPITNLLYHRDTPAFESGAINRHRLFYGVLLV